MEYLLGWAELRGGGRGVESDRRTSDRIGVRALDDQATGTDADNIAQIILPSGCHSPGC